MNYVCPNVGCGHCADMRTKEELRKHLKDECKLSFAVCVKCELPFTQNEVHDCVKALKRALSLAQNKVTKMESL